jgi:hypothetical protein
MSPSVRYSNLILLLIIGVSAMLGPPTYAGASSIGASCVRARRSDDRAVACRPGDRDLPHTASPSPLGRSSNTVVVTISGPSDNQTFSADLDRSPLPETLGQATARFGLPVSRHRYGPEGGVNCRVIWPAKHITGTFTVALGGLHDGCITGAGTMVLTLGSGWTTNTGLAVGQPVAELRHVYPDARVRGDHWALVRYFYGAGFYVTELGAVTSRGRITALTVAGVPDE